jgi:hypothetical protein
LRKANYILVCGLLSISILTLAGCKPKNTNTTQASEIMATPTITSTPTAIKEDVDLTTWDDAKVYTFLNEVHEYVRGIPLETTSKEQIIEKYEKYFTHELSGKIFDSLYVKTDQGWKVPDGDGGYFFTVPDDKNEVKLEFNKDYIIIRETYEIGMFSAIEYTIRHLGKPVITDWKLE